MQELKEIAKKEIEKIEKVLENCKVVNPDFLEIFNLATSYFQDAKYFFEKKDYVRAFEAVVITWAYLDCGLHLKMIEIDERYKAYFTV